MKCKWKTSTPMFPADSGFDPAIDWSLGPASRYFFSNQAMPEYVPLLIWAEETGKMTSLLKRLNFSASRTPATETLLLGQNICIPDFYFNSDGSLKPVNAVTAFAPLESLLSFAGNAPRQGQLDYYYTLGATLPKNAICHEHNSQNASNSGSRKSIEQPANQSTKKVVVGVIDDGIAFANERFCSFDLTTNRLKSRVQYIWLQGANCSIKGRVCNGLEYSKAQIDEKIATFTKAGNFDEESFYLDAGLTDFSKEGRNTAAMRAAHGTHVLDIAAGFDPNDVGQAKEAGKFPIIAVQLPTVATIDTSGGHLARYVIDAIHYIIHRADEANGPVPIVINLSYGVIAGSHDGLSILEREFDTLIRQRRQTYPKAPLEIVIPTGNAHLSQCHALVSFPSRNNQTTLHWRVQPDDQTPSSVEVWLPYNENGDYNDVVSLSVKPPDCPESFKIGKKVGQQINLEKDGETVARIDYSRNSGPNGRAMFLINILPTASKNRNSPLAASGVWEIKIRNKKLKKDQVVETWIQRDDTPFGYPTSGRQSYFDEVCYTKFDEAGRPIQEDFPEESELQRKCMVQRRGLINALATGDETVVISGYLGAEKAPAQYSAGGHVAPKNGVMTEGRIYRPDASATSEDSIAHFGILAAGTKSGSTVRLGGTSIAAPQVTRMLAAQLAQGLHLPDTSANRPDYRTGRQLIEAKATIDEATMPKPPLSKENLKLRIGHGRLRLPSTRRIERFISR